MQQLIKCNDFFYVCIKTQYIIVDQRLPIRSIISICCCYMTNVLGHFWAFCVVELPETWYFSRSHAYFVQFTSKTSALWGELLNHHSARKPNTHTPSLAATNLSFRKILFTIFVWIMYLCYVASIYKRIMASSCPKFARISMHFSISRWKIVSFQHSNKTHE